MHRVISKALFWGSAMAPKTPETDASTPPNGNPEPSQISVPEAAFAPPSAVGIALRQARQSKNQTIEQVAARLRIKSSFLAALEAGDTQALPGHVYALGFVRSYAEHLELDPVETVRDYKREADDHAHQVELTFPVASIERQSSGIPVMVVLGALLLAGLAGWQITQTKSLLIAEGIPTPPGLSNAELTIISGTANPAPAPGEPAPHIATALLEIARASAPQISAQGPAPLAPAGPVPWPAYVLPLDVVAALNQRAAAVKAPPPTPQLRPKPPVAQAATINGAIKRRDPENPSPRGGMGATAEIASLGAAPLPPIPPTVPAARRAENGGNIYGQSNRNARIVIAAETDIWIQIRDREQNDLFTRMLRAGDSYRVPNRSDLLLFTGNAGGLKLTVDGQAIASLGGDGAIRRDIALDADQLLARTTPQ